MYVCTSTDARIHKQSYLSTYAWYLPMYIKQPRHYQNTPARNLQESRLSCYRCIRCVIVTIRHTVIPWIQHIKQHEKCISPTGPQTQRGTSRVESRQTPEDGLTTWVRCSTCMVTWYCGLCTVWFTEFRAGGHTFRIMFGVTKRIRVTMHGWCAFVGVKCCHG